jgi:hypothetical protein
VNRSFPDGPPPGRGYDASGRSYTPKVRLQGFSPRTLPLCRYSPRRGLNPPHGTLLLGSSAAIGPRGAPRTLRDDVQTTLQNAATLAPRDTAAAAA